MDKIKKGFFQRIKLAIFNVEKYQDLALEKTETAIRYFIKLILLLAVIISLVGVYKFATISEFFIGTFEKDFPEFIFSNNVLVANEVVNTVKEEENLSLTLIVDTTLESDDEKVKEYITEISKQPNGVLFLKDKAMLQIDGIAGQTTLSYAELGAESLGEITKQGIQETLAKTNMGTVYISFFVSIAMYMFVLYLISTTIEVLLLSLIGFFTSKIVRVNMKFGQIFSMAIYAITLSVLLNSIYTPIRLLTGFNMEYFSIMYTLIPYVYIITAILMTRSELVKQQIEIGKIQEVQKEVKKEIEEEKQREVEREEQKRKEKEKEEQERRKNGEQPEGSEA